MSLFSPAHAFRSRWRATEFSSRFAGRVNPRFRTPSGSLLFLGGVGAVLALTGTYEELYSLFVFAVWIFFALNAIAMIRLRMKQPDLNRPYRAFGYPVTAYVFLVAAIALTVNLWLVRPVRSTLGLLVIAAGIPLFYRWRKTASPKNSLLLFFRAASNSSPGCQPCKDGADAAFWPSRTPNCVIFAKPVKSQSARYSSLG